VDHLLTWAYHTVSPLANHVPVRWTPPPNRNRATEQGAGAPHPVPDLWNTVYSPYYYTPFPQRTPGRWVPIPSTPRTLGLWGLCCTTPSTPRTPGLCVPRYIYYPLHAKDSGLWAPALYTPQHQGPGTLGSLPAIPPLSQQEPWGCGAPATPPPPYLGLWVCGAPC
jgi:hypothetical protein